MLKRFTKELISDIQRIFTLDLRALALLRIGLASIVILDLFIRGGDLEAHYSDNGVLPLDVLFANNWSRWFISFHTMSGLWQIQLILFILSGIFAFFLLIGWKTKFSTIVSWVFLLSLHNRNPFILQGGDDLLRMLLFWGIFLPWGKRYSVDSLRISPQSNNNYIGLAGAAFIFQLCYLYIFTALLKTSPEWRSAGTALYYALSLDQMVLPVGRLIYPYPELLKILTHIVWHIEIYAPFLLFIPFYTYTFRWIFIFLIFSLHFGISLTLFVGLFFLIGFVSLFGLIPPKGMDKIDFWLKRVKEKIYLRFLRFNYFVGNRIRIIIKLRSPEFKNLRYFLNNFLIMFFFFFVTCWNLQVAGVIKGWTKAVNPLGFALRIDQNWGMFAPSVFKDDGWYIYEGKTFNNKMIDINRDGANVTYAKPPSVVSLFKNDRWRKFGENYLFISNDYIRPYYANFLIRKWNEAHSNQKLSSLEVIYMKEVTQPEYKPVKPSREVLVKVNSEEDDDE